MKSTTLFRLVRFFSLICVASLVTVGIVYCAFAIRKGDLTAKRENTVFAYVGKVPKEGTAIGSAEAVRYKRCLLTARHVAGEITGQPQVMRGSPVILLGDVTDSQYDPAIEIVQIAKKKDGKTPQISLANPYVLGYRDLAVVYTEDAKINKDTKKIATYDPMEIRTETEGDLRKPKEVLLHPLLGYGISIKLKKNSTTEYEDVVGDHFRREGEARGLGYTPFKPRKDGEKDLNAATYEIIPPLGQVKLGTIWCGGDSGSPLMVGDIKTSDAYGVAAHYGTLSHLTQGENKCVGAFDLVASVLNAKDRDGQNEMKKITGAIPTTDDEWRPISNYAIVNYFIESTCAKELEVLPKPREGGRISGDRSPYYELYSSDLRLDGLYSCSGPGTNCVEAVHESEVTHLNAVANPGWVFVRWAHVASSPVYQGAQVDRCPCVGQGAACTVLEPSIGTYLELLSYDFSTCVAEFKRVTCGNGVVDADEQCDTSGPSTTCTATCESSSCGDGTVNATAGEVCDDGNSVSGDGCSSSCAVEIGYCGDGVVDASEECEGGLGKGVLDRNPSPTCNADCTESRCGDGKINPAAGETCDDGNILNGDGCSNYCYSETPVCGDGVVDAGEQCDDRLDSDDCTAGCTTSRCGDGYINTSAMETCDDGNHVGGDGCSSICRIEDGTCGNGLVEGSEVCDDGEATAECDSDCTVPSCGDDVLNPILEECDYGGDSAYLNRCTSNCVLIRTPTPTPTATVSATPSLLTPTPTPGGGIPTYAATPTE